MLDQYFGTADLAMAEDCLSLNIWTPGTVGRRPVLVWIHGGAFVNGTAAAPWFDGARVAQDGDVVLVSLNYRLGLLGFSHLADIAGERFAASGNLGLLDQIAALRWVRANIAAFGGDPTDVTIFGESAGGASVLALMAAPSARGLFRQAIAQSASVSQLRGRARADEAAREVLAALGLEPATAHRLLDLPLDALLAAQEAVSASGAPAFTSFAPTPDGTVLPEPVVEALSVGTAIDIPLVIGTTRDEMHLFTFLDPTFTALDRAGLVRRAGDVLGERAEAAVAAYEAARPGWTPGQIASALASDHVFRVPAMRLARARAELGAPTWAYLFRWASPVFGGLLGSCHGLELPFVFHNLHQPGVTAFTGDGDDREALADRMHAAWLAFAHDGDPGWARYGPARTTMVFDTPCAPTDDPDGTLLDQWEGVTVGP
jgi:para-nitrobenzyl esterase